VAAVRRGDDRAFEILYQRYQRRIGAYVCGMVKDHGRSEDVTQEVFVSALRRMRETERPIAFKPWIYEIAKNACIDQFRRSKRAEEVSLEADEGFAPSDYGRLVGSEPTPDAAVVAKQELDHLCGAFGGLSDTHHEILVLRELEGLSYREIGDRMGMSRPAVESTLFRARRRLTEEYDELVSGARCMRIQTLIALAGEGSLGTRDARRLARHVSHCQPCRREAIGAGLDSALITHVPLRRRAADKVAALLPIPAFLRGLRGGGGDGGAGSSAAHLATGPLPQFAEQMNAGWAKLAAAAALLIVGAGAATQVAPGGDRPVGRDGAAPTEARPVSDRTAADGGAAGTAGRNASGDDRRSDRSSRKRGAGGTSSDRASSVPASTGGGEQPASSGSGSGSGAGGGASGNDASAPGGSTPDVKRSVPPLPPVQLPTEPVDVGGTVDNTVGGVNETVDGVTDTVDGVVDGVDDATGGSGTLPEVTQPLTDTVDQTTDELTDPVGDLLP
jgi:RNA polymerase sigma factor (sigma-70 family)